MSIDVDTILLVITASGSVVAAFASILALKRQYTPPIIQVRDINNSQAENGKVGRYVEFEQTGDPPEWLIRKVKVRQKWIATAGDHMRDSYGSVVGYHQGSDWKNQILFDPPVTHGLFSLHIDAPKHLIFSFDVVLRNPKGVRRRVSSFPPH